MGEKKARSGVWGGGDVPLAIREAFAEPNPGWDWMMHKDYLIARLYDEGRETDRVIAKVVKSRVIS